MNRHELFLHRLSRLNGICIILAVTFGVMAFGSVESWAYALLAVLCFTALFFSLLHDIFAGRRPPGLHVITAIGVAGLALMALQLIPWPMGFLSRLQPETFEVHRRVAEALGESPPSRVQSSFYPHATSISLLKFGAYIALFVAACSYTNTRKRIDRLAWTLVTLGFVASMFGVLQNLAGIREVFGLREVVGRPFGPFVSRNQFAAFAAVSFFTGLGLLLSRGRYANVPVVHRFRKGTLPHAKSWQNLLLGFAVSITGVAIIWSLSRGGIISLTLSGAAVMGGLLMAGYTAGRWKIFLPILLVILGVITYLGWEPVIERLETLGPIASARPEVVDETRYGLWRDAWEMGRTFPYLGTGAGTFLSVYPAFGGRFQRRLARNPHNEYFGVLAETGFGGFILMLAGVLTVTVVTFTTIRRRRSVYTAGYIAGMYGALLAVAIHSVVDFPFRSPGIAAVTAVAAAIVYGLSAFERGTRNRGGKRTTRSRMPMGGEVVLTVIIFAVWLLLCSSAVSHLHAHMEEMRIDRAEAQLEGNTKNVPEFIDASLRTVARHSPHNAELYARIARFARKAAETIEDPAESLRLAESSFENWWKAAELNPLYPRYRLNVVVECLAFGRGDLAWTHARLGADLLPEDPWIRADFAEAFYLNGYAEAGAYMAEEAEDIARRRGLDRALSSVHALMREYEDQ